MTVMQYAPWLNTAFKDTPEQRAGILSLFPSDDDVPGRWATFTWVRREAGKRLHLPPAEVEVVIYRMVFGSHRFDRTPRDLDHYRSGLEFLRPQGRYAPLLNLTQLDALREVWQLLPSDGSWRAVPRKALTSTSATAAGACYFGFFRNQGLVEEGFEKKNGMLDRSIPYFRRGAAWDRITVRPPKAPINECYHLPLVRL